MDSSEKTVDLVRLGQASCAHLNCTFRRRFTKESRKLGIGRFFCLRPSFANLRSPFTGDAVMQTRRSGRDGRLRDWKFWKLEKFFEV